MPIDNLKKRAHLLRKLLTQKNISITHSNALEIIAGFYGYANWDTLCGVFKNTPLPPHLAVIVERTSPHVITLLKNGLLPYQVNYYDLVSYLTGDLEEIDSDRLEIFMQGKTEYYQLKAKEQELLDKQKLMKDYGLSEPLYDAYNKQRIQWHCLGKNKNGHYCKREIYSRYLHSMSDYLKYLYHPKHFCTTHKNQVPKEEKHKLVFTLKEDHPTSSPSSIAEKLGLSDYVVRKLLKEM